ncbi:Zuotin, partial [Coemansia sp. S610]
MPTFTLPCAPVSLAGGSVAVVHAPISSTATARIQAVGERFASYVRRKQDNSTESEDYEKNVLPYVLARTKLDNDSSTTEALALDKVTDDLLQLNPAEWRSQDHYKVLGLSELRFRATPAQIKKA